MFRAIRFSSAVIHLSLLATLLMLSGCSWFGSSKDTGQSGLTETDLNAQRENRFGNGSIPTAEGEGMFHDVFFDYDSAKINEAARPAIDFNVRVLKENSDVKVQLEGHCDERGTAEYNMALGANRAKAVRDVLISYGIPSSRLDTISYGAEVPLDPGHNEAAWAKNRRVHFSAFR